mgnify:CR=1 FL=1
MSTEQELLFSLINYILDTQCIHKIKVYFVNATRIIYTNITQQTTHTSTTSA